LLAFLVAYPFVLSVWFSLSDARIGTAGNFVGLGNFERLFSSSIFLQTLQNSFVFTAAALTCKIVFGMALALLLFRVTRFKRLIRGAVLLPFIVPTALSTLVWWWMFEPLYSVVNWTLKTLRVVDHDLPWLPDPYLAMFVVILVNVWRGLPFFAITLLAGLVAIPRELYEAAKPTAPAGQALLAHHPALVTPVLGVVILFSAISPCRTSTSSTSARRADEHDTLATAPSPWACRAARSGCRLAVPVPDPAGRGVLQLRLMRKAAIYEYAIALNRPHDRHAAAHHPPAHRLPAGAAVRGVRALPALFHAGDLVQEQLELSTLAPSFWIRTGRPSATTSCCRRNAVLEWFANSLIVSVSATVISVVLGVLAAYPLARMRFQGPTLSASRSSSPTWCRRRCCR
jgi:ABC-type sugar transport system permease subunit